ncbi:GNAT family N-acetyltransferase [Hasllibacter sp. MH4015]|uniref:GNAT family N-acetyltransferase n=1 Tax=Hasllibacter sp. MH4015 TaxID=2854029 RepID=UPI001CD340E0|nr:GNAT family N-acetyltransferase [Hasllibacter sp. MH4015]
MSLGVEALTGPALDAALPDLARLRITVFRAFPYLYDGDAENEARYLASYRDTPRAVLIAARDGDRIVGAATGMPLSDHADAAQIEGAPFAPADVFYCAESVLLPDYRGRGLGHRFFDLREAHARALGFPLSAFCAVARAPDHPQRPADYRPLDPFWRKRGYAPVPGAQAHFDWTDVGDTAPTTKILNVWTRAL